MARQLPDPRLIVWDHNVARQKLYPELRDQLDMLWHDIDNGLFGDQAKTGSFYTTIKTIKETHPVGSTHRPFANLPGPDGTFS
jgi:hypothetical protein